MIYFGMAVRDARKAFQPQAHLSDPPSTVPSQHACGRCGSLADLDSVSPISGAACYFCVACSRDGRPWPTLVSFGPFANIVWGGGEVQK
jgi:hypothetical protein